MQTRTEDMMKRVMNTYEWQRACDRMRTGWRTAVDSKYTGHWRLGLTIVLLWSRHRAFYISKYHQGQHLTMHVWEAHTCMTNHWRPQNVCIQRKRISSSLPLALAAFWEFLYNSSLSVYRSNMEWSGKPFRERDEQKKKKKPLFL